ncbi:MAG TPA: IPT/TIG domain-containing protein [Anaeromyxobacter sp.]|nr:IPT/TIG domain-containing protein [Anaeromyxobacter sp.]
MITTSSSSTPDPGAAGLPGPRARRPALLLLAALVPALAASAGGSTRPQGSQPPSPSVGSCRPASGPPGTRLTIRGSNFQAGATVELGGVPAEDVVVVSGSEIAATAGPHPPGRVTVTVTNPDRRSGSRGWTFRYLAPGGG